MSEVYERITKIQNETIHNKISEKQTVGQHDDGQHCNSKCNIEQKRIEKGNTHIFADAVKCFDKLGLQD